VELTGDVEGGGDLVPPRVLGPGVDGEGLVAQAEPVGGVRKAQGGEGDLPADGGRDTGGDRPEIGKQDDRLLDVVGEPADALDRPEIGPRRDGKGTQRNRLGVEELECLLASPVASRGVGSAAMAMRSRRAPDRSRRAASAADSTATVLSSTPPLK